MLSDKPVIAVLPIEDLARAKDFYEKTLELRAHEVEDMPGYLFVEGDGGVEIILYQRERTKADHTVATFLVEDIETEIKELKGKGVNFEQYDQKSIKTDANGISAVGGSKAAWFKDSEGNILGLTEFTEVEEDLNIE